MIKIAPSSPAAMIGANMFCSATNASSLSYVLDVSLVAACVSSSFGGVLSLLAEPGSFALSLVVIGGIL